MATVLPKKKILESLKNHKERTALVTVVVISLFIIGGALVAQKSGPAKKELLPEVSPEKIELNVQNQKGENGSSTEAGQRASFLLKPTPEELLQQLTSLENFNEDAIEAKYRGLRVMWPAYFFSLQAIAGSKATLILDVAEDGFGVAIESEVDTALFSQLSEMVPGVKLWIGGEITAIDRSGTGTVYLNTEHLHFGDDPVIPALRQQVK